jgi:hypothetical protein
MSWALKYSHFRPFLPLFKRVGFEHNSPGAIGALNELERLIGT